MQGSYRDTVEKFTSKGKDSNTRQLHKNDRQFRDRRRNRHNDE